MVRTYHPPATIQVYLGSGKIGARLRKNLEKLVPPNGSLSETVVALLKKAEPDLFKGVDNGKK
jgi:hypothetical protein